MFISDLMNLILLGQETKRILNGIVVFFHFVWVVVQVFGTSYYELKGEPGHVDGLQQGEGRVVLLVVLNGERKKAASFPEKELLKIEFESL